MIRDYCENCDCESCARERARLEREEHEALDDYHEGEALADSLADRELEP